MKKSWRYARGVMKEQIADGKQLIYAPNHQPSAISHQPSAISHQPSAIG
jgi:hypothetical protein